MEDIWAHDRIRFFLSLREFQAFVESLPNIATQGANFIRGGVVWNHSIEDVQDKHFPSTVLSTFDEDCLSVQHYFLPR